MNLFRVLINVMYVTYDQFVKDAVAKRGMFAAEPTKEMAKLRATYDATNRRMAEAIADAEFDKLLKAEGVSSYNPCKFLPFCASGIARPPPSGAPLRRGDCGATPGCAAPTRVAHLDPPPAHVRMYPYMYPYVRAAAHAALVPCARLAGATASRCDARCDVM